MRIEDFVPRRSTVALGYLTEQNGSNRERIDFMFNGIEFGTYYEAIAWELRGALSRYYDKWLEILCMEETERPLYLSTIEQKRVTVVVLTCALIEHTINFYLGTKCDTARFEVLQWKDLAQKWKRVPRLFVPAYRL